MLLASEMSSANNPIKALAISQNVFNNCGHLDFLSLFKKKGKKKRTKKERKKKEKVAVVK